MVVPGGVETEEAAEAADVAEHLGAPGRGDHREDELDRPPAGVDVDPGGGVGGRGVGIGRGCPGRGAPAHARERSAVAPQGRPFAELHPDRNRVGAGEAGVAEAGAGGVDGLDQVLETQVLERVDVQELGDLVGGLDRGQQLGAVGCVDAVEARPLEGRRRDPQVDLDGTGVPEHGDHGPGGRAPHDGVVDHDDPLAGDVLAQRVELAPDPAGPLGLGRGDEGPPDVAVLDQPLTVGDARGDGVALGRRHARVGDAHHQVGSDRALGGEQLAHPPAGTVHLVAVEGGVRAGEVDELEDAQLGVDPRVGEGPLRADLRAVDDHHLAGLQLADEGGPDDVQRGRLGREHPARLEPVGRVEPSEAEGAEPVGIADPDEPVGVEQDEREGTLELREHPDESPLEVGRVLCAAALGLVGWEGLREELGDQVAVGGDQARQHVGDPGQGGRVGQVAVVGQPEPGPPDAAERRLGVGPVTRTGRRVAGVPDGQMAAQTGELALVEHGGHEAHVPHHGDEVAVADRHARRLLATVLEGEEPVEGQVCHGAPRGVDPEDSARFLGLHHRLVTARTGARRARQRRNGCTCSPNRSLPL